MVTLRLNAASEDIRGTNEKSQRQKAKGEKQKASEKTLSIASKSKDAAM